MGIGSTRINRAAAEMVTLTGFKIREWARSAPVLGGVVIILFAAGKLATAEAATITAVPPVNVAVGADALLPGGGFDLTTNYKPYAIPGQAEEKSLDPCTNKITYVPGSPFALSYANSNQPIQSSDWWSSMGFQLQGWIGARGGIINCVDTGNPVAQSQSFTSEPFYFQFVDFNQDSGNKGIFGTFPAEAGVALWNLNNFQVATNAQVFAPAAPTPTPTPVGAPTPTPTPVGAPTPTPTPTPQVLGYNSNLDLVGYGNVGPSHQARVTIGLEGVHPLREDEFPIGGPTSPPWTNIQVQSYSDWGVQASFHDKNNTNQLNFFANNGSPFVWFQRTKGTAAFNVWVGGVPLGEVQGSYKQVQNTNGVLIVSVTTIYVPNYNNRQLNNNIPATSYYAIWANKGKWTSIASANGNSVAKYQDADATAVIVTALPHNFATDTDAVKAWNFMQPYACRETTNTQLTLPTPPENVTVDGAPVTLGYSPASATITGELSIDNAILPGFESSCTSGDSLQMIFPHHRKVLVPSQQKRIVTAAPGPLIWNTLLGPAMAYLGNTMYLQNQTRGIMPMLPSVSIDNPKIANPTNPLQNAAQDIYETLKAWYFVEEKTKPSCSPSPTGCIPPTGASFLDSFPRNPSTYMNVGDNTYITGTTTMRELMVVADQLAQTSNTTIKGVPDTQLGETKDQAAGEIRNFTLRTLEEMIGQWGDVYSSNFLTYNGDYNTMYGYPTGYGDVGHLADHHYHYGYFLRAAAAIGRYDPAWLKAHMTIITNLVNDVACFNCNGTSGFKYPPLRNFNPFYGHSWADGAAYGGNNQESTSEAINFEVGLIELGDLTQNNQWRDLGLYLYEQEINSVQQYWLNQDADLTDNLSSSACPTGAAYTSVNSVPPVCYNGNWPRGFVTYKRTTDNSIQHHTLTDQLFNQLMTRTTFFDASPFAAYVIEAVPAGPSGLYLSRNLPWLKATWAQFMSDNDFYQTQKGISPILESVYGNAAATLQGELPTSGSGIEGTGLAAALARINPVHPYYTAAMDTEAKYIAYTISALGSLNGSYAITTPSGGAFTSGPTTSFVAYNPTASPISATFKGSPSAGPFTIPPDTEQTYQGGKLISSFTPGDALDVPPNRLYFHANRTLTSAPGTLILPSSGSYPFPTDTSLINKTFVTIPVRGDGKAAQFPPPQVGGKPDPAKILTFIGSFSGNLIGAPGGSCQQFYPPNGPIVCDPTKGLQTVDRFALYNDECLTAGWQRCMVPKQTNGNGYNMMVSYYFDTTKCNPDPTDPLAVGKTPSKALCNADRIENYGGIPLGGGVNTWALNNESNEYKYTVNLGFNVPDTSPAVPATSGFNGYYGLGLTKSIVAASCGGNPNNGTSSPYYNPLLGPGLPPGPCAQGQPSPAHGLFVPVVNNGAVVVQFWGGAGPSNLVFRPIPLSVDADPITNRASWFQPPYAPAVGPTPTPTATPKFTPTPTPKPTGVIVTPTPTRTPTRTPTGTPTRTATPTPTPKLTPTPTPKLTPTPTPKFTPTPTPKFTPTATPTAVVGISPICQATALGGGSKITIGVCDGTAGNVYIASISSYSTTTITPPSGWTTIGQKAASIVMVTTFWHRSSGSEPASYTWTCSAACYPGGGIEAYKGVVSSGSPVDANSTNSGLNVIPETALSVNTTAANDYVIATCGDGLSTTGSWSAGTQEWLVPFRGGSYFMNTYTDKPGPVTPGATGPISFTVADGRYWSCQQIALLADASNAVPAAQVLGTQAALAQASSSTGLWVPNLGSDSISEYTGASLSASGTPAANAVIQSSGGYFSSLKTPDAVTFDSSNNLWSTNCHGGPDSQGSVTEFTLAQLQSLHSDNRPTPVTVVYNNPVLGSLDCPTGSAFDQSGNLWVANNGTSNGGSAHLAGFGAAQLSGYTNVQPQTSIYGGGLSDPLGMTFDRSHNLWVADLRAGNNGALFQYGADQLSTGGTQAPKLIVSSASLSQPETVVIDQSGNLWTVNCGNATLQKFAAGDLVGSGTIKPVPQVTIDTANSSSADAQGFDCKEGLVLDSSGGLWVANYYSGNFGSLVRFAPGQLLKSGNPAPEVLIDSTSTGSNISRPFLIGFGPAIE